MSLEEIGKQAAKDCAKYKFSKEIAKMYKRFAKQEVARVRLLFKYKRLRKVPVAKRFLKLLERQMNEIFIAEREKIVEAAIMGHPIIFHPNGKIKAVKNYWNKAK